MRRLTVGTIAFLMMLLSGAGRANNERADRGLSDADRSFATEAAPGGMMEVHLGRLARDKSASEDVKQFAARMIRDHSKANDELMKIAKKKGLDLPTELSSEAKATSDRLSKLSGMEFDRQYVSEMVTDHEKDAAAFEKEATSGSDRDLRKFAERTLTVVKAHLRHARELNEKLRNRQAAQR